MQFVSKSGGNQYRGTVYSDYENRAWQSVNIDDDQIRRSDRAGSLPPDQANKNTNWSSGAFLRPLNIVPPRIVRLGVKLDW